jgi:predicted nicotinamide N-methyase
MGLCGTVAARLGARVLFADLETPPLLFAILNSLPDRPRVRARRMNWRVDRLKERFDLILGADILYERSQWPFLDIFWKAHLSAGGAVLLGEPGRPLGDEFPDFAAGNGWKVVQRQQPVSSQKRPIRVFELAG